jgi:phosphatidylinositol 4-kinase
VRVLKHCPPDTLLFYIPQLVQSVRHDAVCFIFVTTLYYFLQLGFVSEFIIWACGHSQILAHQLLWNMTTNMYMDDESKQRDVQLYEPLQFLCRKVC